MLFERRRLEKDKRRHKTQVTLKHPHSPWIWWPTFCILWRMKEPSLNVIGVYRPVISDETWRQQFQVTGDEQLTRGHFEKLVLIEAVVEGLTGRLDFSKFGQMLSGYRDYPDNMQVGMTKGCSLRTAKL